MRNIEKDILEEGLFPKVDLSQIDDEVVKRYAGIIKDFPTQQDLDNDEILGNVLPCGSGSNSTFRVSDLRVVFPTTYVANILCHSLEIYWFPQI